MCKLETKFHLTNYFDSSLSEDMVFVEVNDSGTNMERELNNLPKYLKSPNSPKLMYKPVGVSDYMPLVW